MKKPIQYYKYGEEINKKVTPIIEDIQKNKILEAQKKIALLAFNICEDIEKGVITAKVADDYFTLLDIYKGDNLKDVKFDKAIEDLLFECMTLHDLGTNFGPELSKIKDKAEDYLLKDVKRQK